MVMKLLLVACLCLLAQAQAQNLFGRFFRTTTPAPRPNANRCSPNPCGNNAGCQTTRQSYVCTCNAGYTGNPYVSCTDINECRSSPCSQNEICLNTDGSYTCLCRPGYERRFGSCRAIQTTTTTTTTTTSTPRTTNRRPSDLDLCNNKNRTWSECIGNPPTRVTIDSCALRTQVCTDGVLLGNLFVNNFLPPSATTGSGTGGSRTGTLGGRTLTTGNANNGENNATCQVQRVVNARGEVIAGKCQEATSSSRSKRQAPTFQTKRDLLIMLDESFSIGVYRYEKVKRIAAAIVKLLCEDIRVHPDYTRVAVTSFNGQVYFNIRLRSIRRLRYLDNDANRLADYIINRIFFHGGYNARRTCLISALQHAYNTALDAKYGGRRGDPYVEQDIIIVSDGCENCVARQNRAREIQEITSFFITEEVNVYVIGIGLTDYCKETLSLLALGGKCYHFFYLTEWDYDVDDFIFQLENPPANVCLNAFEHPSGQCLPPF